MGVKTLGVKTLGVKTLGVKTKQFSSFFFISSSETFSDYRPKVADPCEAAVDSGSAVSCHKWLVRRTSW